MYTAACKNAKEQENNKSIVNQQCDESKCLCKCCVTKGLVGKARFACPCNCNKCKCARSRGKDKGSCSLKQLQQMPSPSKLNFIQVDPSKKCMSPKRAMKNKKPGRTSSTDPTIADAQQRESMMDHFEYSVPSPGELHSPVQECMEDRIGMQACAHTHTHTHTYTHSHAFTITHSHSHS